MNYRWTAFILSISWVMAGSSYAATGYVDNSEKSVVRTGYGECLHTGRWGEENFISECDAVPVAAVEIVRVTKLEPVTLKADTLFAFDSAELSESGKALLDQLASKMQAAGIQDQKIDITGYADRIGPEEYNRSLSERRAAAVRDYLVSKGIAADRIAIAGLGSANPVVECEGLRGDALIQCLEPNRRTEIEFSAMELIEVEKAVEEVATPEKK